MSWQHGLTIPAGAWIQATSNGGINLDLMGSIGETEILNRVRQSAGPEWVATAIVRVDAFSFAIIGRTSAEVPTTVIEAQIANAINSFWLYAFGSVTVRYSTNINPPPVESGANDIASAVRFASVAVVALIGLYIFVSLRKGL